MSEMVIEQAIYGSQGSGGYRFLARSYGFLDDWLPEAQRLCAGFGERPAGVRCHASVFAQPFGKRHVAVIQVADQGTDDAGRPGALGFRLLLVPRGLYEQRIGDPFAVAERFPPPWHARGNLPELSWPDEPPPYRTVEEVQRVLKRADGPTLLGGVQVLVDGGRLVFERTEPDLELLRNLWTLLPASSRCSLWPASFVFGNTLGFDTLVVPRATGEEYANYVTEEKAGDYPEGRYELNLQIAAEEGDQAGLDALFARRSLKDTWRLGVYLFIMFLVLSLALKILVREPGERPAGHKPAPAVPKGPAPAAPQEIPGGAAHLELPAVETYSSLQGPEREALVAALHELAEEVGVPPLWEPAAPALLLARIDERLGTPNPSRDPGPLRAFGPPQRQLQALLWKHEVTEYNDPRLRPVELVERLARKVAVRKPAEKPHE